MSKKLIFSLGMLLASQMAMGMYQGFLTWTPRLLKLVSFGAASVPCYSAFINNMNKHRDSETSISSLQDVPEPAASWVRNELMKYNFQEAKHVPIKMDKELSSPIAIRHGKMIVFHPNTANLTIRAIEYVNSSDFDKHPHGEEILKFLNRNRAILAHEICHLKEKHSVQRIAAYALAPFMTEAAALFINQHIRSACGIKSGSLTRAMLSTLCFVPGIAIKGLVSKGIIEIPFSRWHEKQADNYACVNVKDQQSLEALADYFLKEHEGLKDVIDDPSILTDENKAQKNMFILLRNSIKSYLRVNKNDKLSDIAQEKRWPLQLLHTILDFHHPLAKDRAEKFKKAAEKLHSGQMSSSKTQ